MDNWKKRQILGYDFNEYWTTEEVSSFLCKTIKATYKIIQRDSEFPFPKSVGKYNFYAADAVKAWSEGISLEEYERRTANHWMEKVARDYIANPEAYKNEKPEVIAHIETFINNNNKGA